mgnify:CR=1 FL=1
MAYIGHSPSTGEDNNFKILDDISSYTLTFDGSSSSVVSAANDTIYSYNHRFVQGQRVTYNNGGGGNINGLTSGSVYFVIKEDHNNIKLATTAARAASGTAEDLSLTGTSGSSHTLNVAFDGVNTKFKATHTTGKKARITRSAQLVLSVNGVIQQPHDSSSPSTGFGFDLDGTIVFSQAPQSTDAFWGHILTNNNVTFDISDNKVDHFSGDGSTSSFTLSKSPPNNENILVTIDGVVQYPNDSAGNIRAYSVAANVINLTTAPGSGTQIEVRHIGFAGATTGSGGGGVTGVYGRTGNVVLLNTDNITVNDAAITGDATITGDLTVNGTTTTIDTTLKAVDRIEVADNSANVAVAVTQAGTGDILKLYDNTTEVFTVGDGNKVGIADSIYHIGDGDTAIRFPDPDTFTVETAGTERLRIGSTGVSTFKSNVSIRNNSGVSILSLIDSDNETTHEFGTPGNGDLRITVDKNDVASGQEFQLYMRGNDAGDLGLHIDHDKNVKMPNGKLGVGTVTPGNTLHLGGTQGVGARWHNYTSGNSAYLTLESGDKFQSNVGGSGEHAWVSAGGRKMTLTNAGVLGIGTGDNGLNAKSLESRNIGLSTPTLTWGGGNPGQIFRNEGSELKFGLTAYAPYALFIQANTSGSGLRQITLNPMGGSVGIGITDPQTDAGLVAKYASTFAPSVTWNATGGHTLRCEGSELVFGLSNSSPHPYFMQARHSGDGARHLAIQPAGGNVMIATTDSSTRTLNLKGTFGILSPSQNGVIDMSVTDAGEASIAPYLSGGSSLVLKTNASGVGVAERLRIASDGGTKFTRGTVGGTEANSNDPGKWFKVGTWAGVGVDAAARATITVLGAATHDSNSNVSGETKIHLAFSSNPTLYGYFYSTTAVREGIAGVAHKYDSSAKSAEIWVKYREGYSSTSCFADVTNGYFTGSNIATGSTDTPSGATLLDSYYNIWTSDGTTSLKRLAISGSGLVGIGTPASGSQLSVARASGNSALTLDCYGVNRSRLIFRNNVVRGTQTNIDAIEDDLRLVVNSNERLRCVGDTGYVGIGITNPAEKFQVNGGNIAIVGGTSYKIDTHPLVSYASFSWSGGTYAARLGSTGTSTIRHTQIYGGGYPIATFDGVNRRLGIGETNPDYMIHLKGGVPAVCMEDTDGTHGQSIIESNGDNLKIRCDAGNASSGGGSNISLQVDGSERVRINNTGQLMLSGNNVGFGVSIVDSTTILSDSMGHQIIAGTPWYTTSCFDYNTSKSPAMDYYWIKLVKNVGSSGLAYLEYMATGDTNYPRSVRGTIEVLKYANSSMSICHDQQTAEKSVVQLVVDSNQDVWIRFHGYDWNHDFRYRMIYGESVTINSDFTVGTNAATVGRMRNSDASPPNASIDIIPGSNIRWDLTNANPPNSYYSNDYRKFHRVQISNNLSITGSISKGSGSFKIPHPLVGLSTTKDLVHSFIEGPQCDNIYRGKVDLVGGTATVNIDTKVGMSAGTFVALNRDIQCFTTNETGWTNVKGTVSGNTLTITAQDNSCTDTVSWMVVGERQDDIIKSSDLTDNDGNLILEPARTVENLNGTDDVVVPDEFK